MLRRSLLRGVSAPWCKETRYGMKFARFYSTERKFEWKQPTGKDSGVVLYNSLTKQKERLIHSEGNEKLAWYSCGPTVYDHSHIGHARCYLQQDIALRILQYFNIDVHYVMGITDIDDKIINKARELPKTENANSAIQQVAVPFENSFWEDMQSLRIRPPHGITRVSDHMDDIEGMIQRIYEKGHAYLATDGSIYFDTGKYRAEVASHPVPNRSSLSLDDLVENSENIPHKKHVADFALWKASGDNSAAELGAEWDLGLNDKIIKGRPGWHIECSAMCSKMFGDTLDVHAGGIDLLFPHHCNEVAQSQSFFSRPGNSPGENVQWPNYFFHIGHLYIKGAKMSKSLKNFITIKEFLEKYTADDMRWFCLQNHYRSNVEFSEDRIEDARNLQAKFNNFLHESRFVQRTYSKEHYWRTTDHELFALYNKARVDVRNSLKDDFDTPAAIQTLSLLMKQLNLKFQAKERVPGSLVHHVAQFIENSLGLFGFQQISAAQHSATDDKKIVDCLVNCRDKLRKIVLDESTEINSEAKNKLLTLSDNVRDQLLDQRIEIKDRQLEGATWRVMDEAEFEHYKKQSIFTSKLAQHQEELLSCPPLTPEEFLNSWKTSGLFSKFDEEGIPAQDTDGTPVSRSRIRKYKKQYDKQVKRYQQYEALVRSTFKKK